MLDYSNCLARLFLKTICLKIRYTYCIPVLFDVL